LRSLQVQLPREKEMGDEEKEERGAQCCCC
jgi:hypothetical protein